MDNGKVGIMSRQQAISSSLTGREMVQSTTQGSWRKAKNGTVYTVEGNSGDECKQRNYPVGSSVIYGYGIPAY